MIIVPSNVSGVLPFGTTSNLKVTGITYQWFNETSSKGLGYLPLTLNLPAHNAGDMIIMWGLYFDAGSAVPMPRPSPWIALGRNDQGAYQIATSSSTQSGTWTADTGSVPPALLLSVVISGQNATPVGAYATGLGYAGATSINAPAVTLQSTTGNSLLLHLAADKTSGFWTGGAPAGYTTLAEALNNGSNGGLFRLIAKNSTTSDGAVTIGTVASSGGYTPWTTEIRSA